MKNKSLILVLITLIFCSIFPSFALAETVLEKIKRTGELNAGVRKDAIPFGYVNQRGKWTGYSVDLIHLIHKRLEKDLNQSIKLNLREATIDSRFRIVQRGDVDIMCGATTITQTRSKRVDFSVPFFMTGAQFLVKLEDAPNFDYNGSLNNIPIAFLPGTTTQEIIPQIYPSANWKNIKNREEGVRKLKRDEVKAVVSDGILLLGEIVQQGNNIEDFVLLPSQPITRELYGCILPQKNPQWKQFVNVTILSPENRILQKEWFSINSGEFPYIIENNN
ncbi:putative extracellular solute-binding protein, family 3 [Crocosphaera subtropica ATCC 51142]|uniref:Extracellular solute-binding protein, family 3 n=1 Tax=Crocosphaera subtropica (strain ATCC 51142 / BH68) TaxID=43989 RepID=B1WRE9_CROS5|nr:amino acid ABC transporter substrate-binding protein [Crocosphaera subtropica]ACB51798.1 putative extracellular solute-binding protein, family 3 [Crocosphaera subtropica ATCC 51142]